MNKSIANYLSMTNRYFSTSLEIFKVLFISVLILLTTTSCKKIEKEIKKTQQELFLEKISALENSISADIDASTLCPIFNLGSDNTDLQRERVLNEINGRTVIWELQVYEVKSTEKNNVYSIQTSSCIPKSESKTINSLDDLGAEFLKALGGELGFGTGGKKINRNVATFIELFAKDDADIQKINSLKTGNWIKVKGKINGTFLRSINLNPAIFWDENKTSQLKNQRDESKNLQVTPKKTTINTYFQVEKEFSSEIKNSNRTMVVQIALMTNYDNRVFDNFKKHEFVIRSEILEEMRQTTNSDASHPDFRAILASKIKKVINEILKNYEDFGGIEDVFFTSFVIQ